MFCSITCQLPCFAMSFAFSARTPMSAMENTPLTRNTARTMHIIVMRLCFLFTLAEMGMRSR